MDIFKTLSDYKNMFVVWCNYTVLTEMDQASEVLAGLEGDKEKEKQVGVGWEQLNSFVWYTTSDCKKR